MRVKTSNSNYVLLFNYLILMNYLYKNAWLLKYMVGIMMNATIIHFLSAAYPLFFVNLKLIQYYKNSVLDNYSTIAYNLPIETFLDNNNNQYKKKFYSFYTNSTKKKKL